MGGTFAATSHAHRPTFSDGTAVDAEHAIAFEDVQISRVVYHSVTGASLRLWLTFEIDAPQDLFLQIGVPMLDRLRAYRPALMLLGPGLPELHPSFEIPTGLGGRIFDTGDVENPKRFFEPFTRTRSWILREATVRLPEAGRYYVVAFDPGGDPGKLWVGMGRKEVWGARDLLKMSSILREVRRFHEVLEEGESVEKSERTIFDFESLATRGEWISVNDNVMGGVSTGEALLDGDGALVFRGVVSLENDGGFASIRSRPGTWDLSEFDRLRIRVRGDGHRYACNLRTDVVILAGSYQVRFETKKGEWQEIDLPFDTFAATSFGEVVPDAPALEPGAIRSFGFSISDGQAGPFELEVDWIAGFVGRAKASSSE